MKTALTLLLGIIMLSACTRSMPSAKEKTITVTVEPLRYLTQAVVGDVYKIRTIIPKGGNPETYEPRPAQIEELHHSAVFFLVGELGFEKSWLDKIIKDSPHLLVCSTSQKIDLIGEHDHLDPHIWASPRNMSTMARTVCQQMCAVDKEHAPVFQKNHTKLQESIRSVDDSIRTILGDASPAFMIFHPTLSYFARDYGLRQIAIEEHGKEPSARRMKQLIQEAKKYKVKTIFVQEEFDTRYAELIAQETGAGIVSINPLTLDWEPEMIRIAHILKDGEKVTN